MTLKLKAPPQRPTSVSASATTAAHLYRLRDLSGLDYYEREMVCRMLAHGVKHEGDQRCLDAMVRRHLT